MSAFLRGVGLILTLELKQRVRGVAWYVILGVFFALVALVTVGVWVVTGTWGGSGGGLFSSIVYFVLLLASLISPALGGNAINGEREGGTLATIQVTSVTTGQIVIGKWLAAWLTSLSLLVVTVPFLGIAVAIGEVSALTVVKSLAVLAAELGIFAALGVGLSGLIRKPLFSVVVTYLTVAALSIGTLIAFGIAGSVTQVEVRQTTVDYDYGVRTDDDVLARCAAPVVTTYRTPRFDLYWGVLAANPFVVVADASYGDFTADGAPNDLFGYIAVGVRQAQIPPETDSFRDWCHADGSQYDPGPTAEQLLRSGVPSWFIGLTIQVVLGALALFGAWLATRTPSGRLAKGSRIA
ncbi:ABC transporter permease [Herbiconiux sp. P17]|uniref:ABC transporter permease n=1 Tax=Herbiconiux wuyangfengii TaxID=3342794 RepID=UPI0035B7BBB1